jgi:hypothetical protein
MAFRFNNNTGKFELVPSAKDPKDTNGDGVVDYNDSKFTTTTTGAPRPSTTTTAAPTTTVPRSTTTSTMAPTTTVPRTTTTSTMAPTTTMAPATTTTVRPTTTTVAPTTTSTVAPKTTTSTTVPMPPSTTTTTTPPKPTGGPPAVVPPVLPPVNVGPKPYSDTYIAGLTKSMAAATDAILQAPFALLLKNALDANTQWEQDQRTIKFNQNEQNIKNAKEARDAAAKAAASNAAQGSAAQIAAAKAKAERDKEKRDNEFTIGRDNRAEQFRIDAENRANARTDALAEVARIRGYDGGMAAADLLESRSGERLVTALQAVKDLYDPLDEKTAEELGTQLSQIATNFATARGQVDVAGVDFLENFAKSLAYTQVPITQFSAGQNPLMEALRQQGASTVEVQNAMDLATATSNSTSDLAKWAANQLNVGQQNMDSAAMNASRGATQTALQGLSSRQPEVEAGMTMKYNDLMATLMRERAAATASANQAGYASQDNADAMRANTMAQYGTPTPTTAVVPDVVVEDEPVIVKTPDPAPIAPAPRKTPEQIAADEGRITQDQAMALEMRRQRNGY